MKKRFLMVCLTLVMLLSVLTIPVRAVPFSLAEEGPWVLGNEYFGGTQGIMKYKGSEENVTIPKTVKNYGVFCVYEGAFEGNTTMKTLTVPDYVTVYGLGKCNVESINMGEKSNATNAAFANCAYLKQINIPGAWEWIPDEMFRYCKSLASIDLHDGITEIGDYAFEGCKSLTSIVLPSQLEKIGYCAFMDCDGLKTITIPKSVTHIGDDAFGFCDGLEKIVVEPGNEYYSSDENGNLYRNGVTKELIWASAKNSGDSYVIAEDVQAIGRAAFLGVEGLTSIRIPENVVSIGKTAFWDCKNLTEVWLEGCPNIGSQAFYGVTAKVYYPGDTGLWSDEKIGDYSGSLSWVPYCTGKHIGPEGTILSTSTCAVPGLAKTICKLCGETYTYELPLLEHSYGEGEIITPSTCYSSGQERFTCVECGYEKLEDMVWAAHKLEDAAKTSNDRHKGKCVYCGKTIETVCNYEVKEVITPSTCAVIGEAIFVCVDCGYEKHGFMPTLPHDFEGVQAVHLSGPMHTRKCNQCGNEERETCPMEETTVAATLTQLGKTVRQCPDCAYCLERDYQAYRISGANRFETAFNVADEMRTVLGVEKFDAIIVTSGLNFADALSGSYLAAVKNAPILLSYNQEYNDRVKIYIRSNLTPGGTVYILGGESAVPASMEEGLEAYTIKRLAGGNRFETNLAILEEAGVGDKPVLVCTGLSFADSLSASASELPILLVWNDLTEGQAAFLESLGGDNQLYVIGGEGAVSAGMAEQVARYGPVERIGGSNRFETSVLIAEKFFDAPEAAVLAYAWNYPDGLCGGPLAAVLDVPLILTMNGYGTAANAYTQQAGVTGGTVLGGVNLISDELARDIFLPDGT